jgi:hypothetical protein
MNDPQSRDEIRSRRLTTEDMVRNQLDRCNEIRSNVELPDRVRIAKWSEAIETLADLLMPWALDEDKKAQASNPPSRGQFVREWDDRPVGVVYDHGEAIVVPTARDCRVHQQIIMGLLDRQGLLVKRRNVSGPSPRNQGQSEETEDNAPALEM